MRFLCQQGIFVETRDGKYKHNNLSLHMRSDHPKNVNGVLLHWGDTGYKTWGAFPSLVEQNQQKESTTHPFFFFFPPGNLEVFIREGGDNAFVRNNGMPYWEFLKHNPWYAANFAKAMSNVEVISAHSILTEFNWTPYQNMVVADIGGSLGSLLREILKRNPTMRGILFDLPEVIELAKKEEHWRPGGSLADRVELVAG
jgi:hypothetical protein